MSGLSRKKIILFVTCCALFLLSSAWLLFSYVKYQQKDKLEISRESGMYETNTGIELRIFREGTIYYSYNGGQEYEYKEPLILTAEQDGTWYDMSFYCVYEDGTRTEPENRVYFVINSDIRKVETDYIVSVWGDEEELFSSEKGIFVRGDQFYEYMERNPDVDILGTAIPANYFSDEELAVHSVIFDRQGNTLINQNCGLKIYGATTRAKNQKSFRLTARYAYDETNSFDYPFFPQLRNENGGEILKYKKLSFHNSGNDNGYGFIRNQLSNELAGQSGFPDVLVSKSVSVYINNRYMGVYWMQNAYGEKYFQEKYGDYEGEMVVLEGAMSQVSGNDEDSLEQRKREEEYNEFCQWLIKSDVQDDAVWKQVVETIDVDNFLHYVAVEYYVNNIDWPHNNLKVYRYVPLDESYVENTVFDGRYRYLLYDLDYSMGLKVQGWFGRDADAEGLERLCNLNSDSAMFGKIIQREECRNLFINYVLGLMNGSFAYSNVEATLAELNGSRWSELTYMMEKTDILKDSLWESDDNDIQHVTEELQKILAYAERRPSVVVGEMASFWELGAAIEVVIAEDDRADLCISGTDNFLTGQIIYYAEVPVEISADANEGITVKGYYLNDSYLEGDRIQVLLGDYVKNGKVTIKMDLLEQECESLRIDSCRTSGDQDYITLKNVGTVNIHLSEYYLSDDSEEMFKYRLPNGILKPGEIVTFYGNKYKSEVNMDDYQLTFSWNSEENVVLSHITEGIIEQR